MTLALVVSLVALVVAGVLMVSQSRLYSLDGRDQEGADAASIAAARVLSTRANAMAAMNQAAAKLVAELALGRGSCAAEATAMALIAASVETGEVPSPDTVERVTQVCTAEGGLESGNGQALQLIADRESSLRAAADSDALRAARAAAAQSGDWDDLGLSPSADLLQVSAASSASFCLAVEEELGLALSRSLPVRREGRSPADAAVAASFSAASEAMAATQCVSWASRLLAPQGSKMDLLAWTARHDAMRLFDGSALPSRTFRAVATARARRETASTVGGLVTDQTWKVALISVRAADSRTRADAPDMPWDDLIH